MARRDALRVLPGEGWRELAVTVREAFPVEELDGIWTFQAVRQDLHEWGTAILSRMDGPRRRIYTARYVHTIKGRERGTFTATVEEVGSGPVETLDELIRGVERRADEEPPVPVPVAEWYPPEDDHGTPDRG
jgi:hypothetical protein